jgi:phosphohistidine swiveling domain-containing protein
MSTAFGIPDMEDVDEDIKKLFLSYRAESEKYTEKMNKVLVAFWTDHFPEFAELAFCIAPSEVEQFSANPKLVTEIMNRKSGCVLSDGTIYPLQQLSDLLTRNNLSLEEVATDGVAEIRGTPVYEGRAQGQVVKILSFTDMNRFKSGDVLVTEMTNPDYLPIMKIASAVVTDEGGATCHAAIACRELKIPCVVGTKIATHALNDGDIVDVDAVRGVITLIG